MIGWGLDLHTGGGMFAMRRNNGKRGIARRVFAALVLTLAVTSTAAVSAQADTSWAGAPVSETP